MKKRNKKYNPQRFNPYKKDFPLWYLMTPYTDKDRKNHKIERLIHVDCLRRGEVSVQQLSCLKGSLRLAERVLDKVENEDQIRLILNEGFEAFERTLKRLKAGNTLDQNDVDILAHAVIVAGDVLDLMERHELVPVVGQMFKEAKASEKKIVPIS